MIAFWHFLLHLWHFLNLLDMPSNVFCIKKTDIFLLSLTIVAENCLTVVGFCG